jgi:hypothetical protein
MLASKISKSFFPKLEGVLVIHLKRVWRLIRHLRTPWRERALALPNDGQTAISLRRTPLAAFEGLFVASMFSTLFWSALTFTVFHRH